MNHVPFIVSAYLATGVVILALIGWVWGTGRALRRRLAALEARGIRRRSQ